MKRATCIQAAAIALLLAGAIEALAQQSQAKAPGTDMDKLIELMRRDVRAEKADIIGKTMSFDATQAAAFWPLYKQYEAERQALGNERLAVIQYLAEHFDSLNDAKAKGLLERSFAIEDKRLALERKVEGRDAQGPAH